MRTLRVLTLAALLTMPAAPALAAVDEAPRHGIGLYVSNIAGSGLTYSGTIAPGLGFHVSGIGWGQGASSFFNVGAALTKDFDRREWGRLYGLVAVGAGVGSFFGGSGLQNGMDIQTNFAPGVGVAMGPIMLELGYSVYRNSGGLGFIPAGGAGLSWQF